MTIAPVVGPQKKFVPVILPWLIAAVALGVYLATLNHWVTFSSLGTVARVSGWTWQPDASGPLYWLVTYPFHWLPVGLVPLALNFLSLVCAVLTLALLARSVALLPHDRTEDQRQREKGPGAFLSLRTAWVPPVIAAIVCGLQLSFWENATVASPDMFDLLLFAYLVRCLLEFRLEKRHSWLLRAAFVYGAAMTNNWGMIGFLPCFIVALVWLKRLSFFNARFLLRMFLLGLAGLSFYLLLPLVNSLAGKSEITFWQMLRFNLASQKSLVFMIVFKPYVLLHGFAGLTHEGRPLWVLALPSLLPVLVLSIRWPSYFGDPSKLGIALTTIIVHLFHVALLLVCVWVAFDPQFSPRHYEPMFMENGIWMLPLYYLGALGVGYLFGYFLLVFGSMLPKSPQTQLARAWVRFANRVVILGIWLLVLFIPPALFRRNLAQIHTTNGPMLAQYTALMAEGLPARRVVLLSDDPRKSFFLQSAFARNGTTTNYLVLDTIYLKSPDYHRTMKKRYGDRWPGDPPKDRQEPFDPVDELGLILALAQSNTVCYLHPSFGFFFELFWPEPHGLVFRLRPYPDGVLFAPDLNRDIITENERFWSKADSSLVGPVLAAINPPGPGANPTFTENLRLWAHLKKEPNREAALLAPFLSCGLDAWAVTLQRAGFLDQATPHFERALALNPDNVAVQANLDSNRSLRDYQRLSLRRSEALEDLFGRAHTWDEVLRDNGPFDDPDFCLALAREFVHNNLLRQGARELARVKALAPENLTARVLLAQVYTITGRPDEALKVVDEIHANAAKLGLSRTNQNALLDVEVRAHLARKDLPGAESVVRQVMTQYPGDEELLSTAGQVYLTSGCYSNALETFEQLVRIKPNDPGLLANQGLALLQLERYDEATVLLTKVLDLETNTTPLHYTVLMNRAIAQLKSDKLEESQRDYETLQKAFPTAYRINFGLGEIAYRKRDTNAAIRYFQLYVANARTNTTEFTNVTVRLTELKRGQP